VESALQSGQTIAEQPQLHGGQQSLIKLKQQPLMSTKVTVCVTPQLPVILALLLQVADLHQHRFHTMLRLTMSIKDPHLPLHMWGKLEPEQFKVLLHRVSTFVRLELLVA
jgi:hypothetical protein